MTRSHHTGEDGAMPLHVVAAAILHDGRVLAARRRGPEAGWEFPGGKVEADETEAAALAREITEELHVPISVADRLGEAADGRIRLVLFAATLVEGQPRAGADHDALRWLAAEDLDALEWLPIDRALVDLVRKALA
jgi:8-oxo-dGTP diphosphatase